MVVLDNVSEMSFVGKSVIDKGMVNIREDNFVSWIMVESENNFLNFR